MNALKEKLAAGAVVTMVNPNYPAPGLVEFLAGLGFDAVFIDCEHGPAGFERVEEMARAARAGGIISVLRPEANLPHLLTRYLDRGVDGLMVPHVDTPEAAREVVDTVRYARYRDHAEKLVIAMIESPTAVGNLDAILAVDGIDVIFVGPGDLSQTMGLAGQMDHPKVREAVASVISRCRAAGRPIGTLAGWDDVRDLIAQGVNYLYIHNNSFASFGARHFQQLVKDSR